MSTLRDRLVPFLLWVLLAGAGCVLIATGELSRLQAAFETDSRIAHRLLSQQVVQHDAVLSTLVLLQPSADSGARRLAAVYPQVLSVERRDGNAAWSDPALVAAEARSRAVRAATLADSDFARGRYRVLLAGDPSSFVLTLDLRAVVPWNEWPVIPGESSIRMALEHGSESYLLQPGRELGAGWRYDFRKQLAADSQPFEVAATRAVGWTELPWRWMLAWAAVITALMVAAAWLRRQRAERRRAEELLRLGQVARLNTLGELAAGMAHELNQPLTAVLANTQAARRLLQDTPPELDTVRDAMQQAEVQARRAAEVLGRLRRGVERPRRDSPAQAILLEDAVRSAIHLLKPEFSRRQVTPSVLAEMPSVSVQAEPVALEQILHNLLTNALQSLDQVPSRERSLAVRLRREGGRGLLTVEDTGPGISPELLPRIFQPFFSTRAEGLGLGLSLCESLANGMGGELAVQSRVPRGAAFTLRLPLSAA